MHQGLTQSGLRADEAAAFRDHVSVVALAGQNLLHLRELLALALCGAPVDAEPDVRSLAGKLPPTTEPSLSKTRKNFCSKDGNVQLMEKVDIFRGTWRTEQQKQLLESEERQEVLVFNSLRAETGLGPGSEPQSDLSRLLVAGMWKSSCRLEPRLMVTLQSYWIFRESRT